MMLGLSKNTEQILDNSIAWYSECAGITFDGDCFYIVQKIA